MIVFPNAKINLGLNVTEKRPDGYHNIETVFYPIPLKDSIEVVVRENENQSPSAEVIPSGKPYYSYKTDNYTLHIAGIPVMGAPNDNLVVKVFCLLNSEFKLPPIHIFMYKHIPSGAGLGGGSADAAFMMRLLNDKFQLGLSIGDMEQRIATLGADCPFFIKNEPVFATGIGNIFTPITLTLKGLYLVIVKPDVFVSTKEAYARIHPHSPERTLIDILSRPLTEWKSTLVNDFESSIFPAYPEIAVIKDKLYDLGAIYASMSGSGSSVFGIFSSPVKHVETFFQGCFCHHQRL